MSVVNQPLVVESMSNVNMNTAQDPTTNTFVGSVANQEEPVLSTEDGTSTMPTTEMNDLVAFSSPPRKMPLTEPADSPSGVDGLYQPEASVDLSATSISLRRVEGEEEDDSSDGSSEYEDDEDHEEALAGNWSEEMDQLIHSRSAFEAVTCLRRIAAILEEVF